MSIPVLSQICILASIHISIDATNHLRYCISTDPCEAARFCSLMTGSLYTLIDTSPSASPLPFDRVLSTSCRVAVLSWFQTFNMSPANGFAEFHQHDIGCGTSIPLSRWYCSFPAAHPFRTTKSLIHAMRHKLVPRCPRAFHDKTTFRGGTKMLSR